MSWKDLFPKENRYFETNNGILYKGDQFELMKQFPNNQIDQVITDPPFGINHKNQKWDKIDFVSFTIKWITIINKIIKEDSKIQFYYPKKKMLEFHKIVNYFDSKKWDFIIQGKTFSQYRRNFGYIDQWVPILIFHGKTKKIENDTQITRRNYFIQNTQNTSKKNKNNPRNFHPSGKDVKSFEYLIQLNSNRGDLIIDPFLGSGTCQIQQERLNRRWIGIEQEEKYCKIIIERFNQGDVK